jgi:hypothetical protein
MAVVIHIAFLSDIDALLWGSIGAALFLVVQVLGTWLWAKQQQAQFHVITPEGVTGLAIMVVLYCGMGGVVALMVVGKSNAPIGAAMMIGFGAAATLPAISRPWAGVSPDPVEAMVQANELDSSVTASERLKRAVGWWNTSRIQAISGVAMFIIALVTLLTSK